PDRTRRGHRSARALGARRRSRAGCRDVPERAVPATARVDLPGNGGVASVGAEAELGRRLLGDVVAAVVFFLVALPQEARQLGGKAVARRDVLLEHVGALLKLLDIRLRLGVG